MIQVSAHVAHESVGEHVVILDLNAGRYFSLEGSAARVWELILDGLDKQAIIQQMLSEYDVSETTLSRDITQLTRQMIDRGLLSRQPS